MKWVILKLLITHILREGDHNTNVLTPYPAVMGSNPGVARSSPRVDPRSLHHKSLPPLDLSGFRPKRALSSGGQTTISDWTGVQSQNQQCGHNHGRCSTENNCRHKFCSAFGWCLDVSTPKFDQVKFNAPSLCRGEQYEEVPGKGGKLAVKVSQSLAETTGPRCGLSHGRCDASVNCSYVYCARSGFCFSDKLVPHEEREDNRYDSVKLCGVSASGHAILTENPGYSYHVEEEAPTDTVEDTAGGAPHSDDTNGNTATNAVTTVVNSSAGHEESTNDKPANIVQGNAPRPGLGAEHGSTGSSDDGSDSQWGAVTDNNAGYVPPVHGMPEEEEKSENEIASGSESNAQPKAANNPEGTPKSVSDPESQRGAKEERDVEKDSDLFDSNVTDDDIYIYVLITIGIFTACIAWQCCKWSNAKNNWTADHVVPAHTFEDDDWQEPKVNNRLADERKDRAARNPKDFTFFDDGNPKKKWNRFDEELYPYRGQNDPDYHPESTSFPPQRDFSYLQQQAAYQNQVLYDASGNPMAIAGPAGLTLPGQLPGQNMVPPGNGALSEPELNATRKEKGRRTSQSSPSQSDWYSSDSDCSSDDTVDRRRRRKRKEKMRRKEEREGDTIIVFTGDMEEEERGRRSSGRGRGGHRGRRGRENESRRHKSRKKSSRRRRR